MPIKLIVVDDHRVVRAGLVALLSQEPSLEVIGEADNGQEALALLEEALPDVVLMDIQMPVMNGVAATRQIKARWPQVEVLILTTYDDDELLFSGLQAGAKGYLLKDAPPEELLRGIQAVAQGQSLLTPQLAAKLVGRLHEPPPEQPTERELEILQLIAKGAANKEIAAALFISENTVKTHISNLFAKLGARDRTEAVTRALSRGWMTL